MERNILFGSILGLMVLFSGCCGSTGSDSSYSSSCTTYGEACTDLCNAAKGTEFDGGSNCFSECTGYARSQGLGDATTCCRESIRQNCQRTCDEMYDELISKYGQDAAMGESKEEFISPCYGECVTPFINIGLSADSCAAIDAGAVIRETMGAD